MAGHQTSPAIEGVLRAYSIDEASGALAFVSEHLHSLTTSPSIVFYNMVVVPDSSRVFITASRFPASV